MSERQPIIPVDIEQGDRISGAFHRASAATFENRPREFRPSSTFYGVRSLRAPFPLWNRMLLSTDGIGTKIEFAERFEDHSTMAYNLVAMVVDDLVREGAEPIALESDWSVNDLPRTEYMAQMMEQIMCGYVAAANRAGIVIAGGETAQLGDRIGGYEDPDRDFNLHYNWGATAVGYVNRFRVVDGTKIRPGDSLVGFGEIGIRSNGATAIRDALVRKFGEHWHKDTSLKIGGRALGEALLAPSVIYTPAIVDMTGGYKLSRRPKAKLTGIAHITGGGQPSKLGRMLQPSGMGVHIDDPIDPPEVLHYAQDIRGLSDEEAYHNLHMGSGMMVATRQPEKAIAIAEKHGIEAKRIGEVVAKQSITIANRGVRSNDDGAPKYLEFPLLAT